MRLVPATLPPGRAKLATSPLPTGSPAAIMTDAIRRHPVEHGSRLAGDQLTLLRKHRRNHIRLA
jgi:hypothetical protein